LIKITVGLCSSVNAVIVAKLLQLLSSLGSNQSMATSSSVLDAN